MGISTHILDTVIGQPAAGVPVILSVEQDGRWSDLFVTTTDQDGRVKHLLPESYELLPGTYRLHYDTATYYTAQKLRGLYPFVDITFTVRNPTQHHHIPLLLTPNSYTTYRGS